MNVFKPKALIPAKHVGSFLLLMFLATFNPLSLWGGWSVSLVGVSVLAIGSLLLYKIQKTLGFKVFYQKYRVELWLLSVYFCVCFFSLYLNIHRYSNYQELINHGLIYIVITMSFPAVIFLFLLPQNKTGLSLSRLYYSGYLPWLYLSVLSLMAIWQYVDFESSKLVSRFFVSSEAWTESNINGFFRISTDLASVLGIYLTLTCCALIHYKNKIESKMYYFCFFVISLFFVAGLVGGKRIFLLTLIVGAVCYMPIAIKRVTWKIRITSVFIVIIIILAASLTVFSGVIPFFPFLDLIKQGKVPDLSSFIPSFNSQTLGGRYLLWNQALLLLENNWFFGGSNGGFRLSTFYQEYRWVTLYKEQNTHNVILQILVETGLVGLSIITLLIAYIVKRNQGNYLIFIMPIFIVMSMIVDYFPDHSLPWIIAVAYCVTLPWVREGHSSHR